MKFLVDLFPSNLWRYQSWVFSKISKPQKSTSFSFSKSFRCFTCRGKQPWVRQINTPNPDVSRWAWSMWTAIKQACGVKSSELPVVFHRPVGLCLSLLDQVTKQQEAFCFTLLSCTWNRLTVNWCHNEDLLAGLGHSWVLWRLMTLPGFNVTLKPVNLFKPSHLKSLSVLK